jgi:hypothetical protein
VLSSLPEVLHVTSPAMMSCGLSVALGRLGWVLVSSSTAAPCMADQPNLYQPAPPMRSRATAWAACAACALALLYAAPSFYWALGGTAGLHSVGGPTEALGRSGFRLARML